MEKIIKWWHSSPFIMAGGWCKREETLEVFRWPHTALNGLRCKRMNLYLFVFFTDYFRPTKYLNLNNLAEWALKEYWMRKNLGKGHFWALVSLEQTMGHQSVYTVYIYICICFLLVFLTGIVKADNWTSFSVHAPKFYQTDLSLCCQLGFSGQSADSEYSGKR